MLGLAMMHLTAAMNFLRSGLEMVRHSRRYFTLEGVHVPLNLVRALARAMPLRALRATPESIAFCLKSSSLGGRAVARPAVWRRR